MRKKRSGKLPKMFDNTPSELSPINNAKYVIETVNLFFHLINTSYNRIFLGKKMFKLIMN